MFDDRAEAAGGRVTPREDQRLTLEVGNAHGVAASELVTVRQNHVEVVDEQASPGKARRLGFRVAPGHVVNERQVGFSHAEMLDRFARLELDDSDGEIGMGATQVTHRGRYERRQRPLKGRQTETKRRALHLFYCGIGAPESREDALDAWPQDRPRTRGAERALRTRSTSPAPASRWSTASCCETADCVNPRNEGGSRDRAEIEHQRERPKPLQIAEQH